MVPSFVQRLLTMVLCTVSFSGITATVSAEEPVTGDTTNLTDDQIDQWVAELSSRDFQTRQSATRNLISGGARVIDSVAEAAEGDDPEQTARCIGVLESLYRNSDESTKKSAEAALEQLAESEQPMVARRSSDALRKDEPIPIHPAIRNRNVQLGIQFRAGRNFRMRTTIRNGQREIEVTDDDRKISIQDNREKDIVVKVTETVDGKEKTTEYEAKDLQELKQKHPEGAKLYEKYTKMGGGAVIRARFQALPAPIPNRRVLPNRQIPGNQRQNRQLPNADGIDAQQLQDAADRMQEQIEQLKKQAQQNPDQREHFQRSIETLDRLRREFQKLKDGDDDD